MINPWSPPKFFEDTEGFYVQEDKKIIDNFNAKKFSSNFKFELELFSEPYVGNIESNIYLLNGSPGVDELDFQQNTEQFRNLARNNLKHKYHDNNFFFLGNDRLKEHPGHKYWKRRLSSLLQDSGNDFSEQIRNVFILEAIAYHQKKFKYIRDLFSYKYRNYLLENAIKRVNSPVFVIIRAERIWMPLLEEYQGKYNKKVEIGRLKSPQNAYLTRNNLRPSSLYDKCVDILKRR